MRNKEYLMMIDVKEQIWLPNVKYLLFLLNTSRVLAWCLVTHVCRYT